MPDLLIELLSEEIPARMQGAACEALRQRMTDGLVEAGLSYAAAAAYATPRRLALHVEGLAAASPALSEERRGPRVGAPEAALEGFLRATGLTREQLEERDDPKGAVWFAIIDRPGRPAADIVAALVPEVIAGFPWPKAMRWGAGSLRWVRPLRAILCILSDEAGAEVVPLDIGGIVAGNTTLGHRSAGAAPIAVRGFDDYVARLKAARVVLDPAERAAQIDHDARNAAFALGLELVDDRALLAEVAGLVEWPVVLSGPIDAAFLDLPPEVLQTSMREHQKFFSLREPASGRITRFVTVANIDAPDGGETILAGNRRVLAARLSDARFFWENDLRVARAGMAPWLERLNTVTFHGALGSQGARIARIAALAEAIAPVTGAAPAEAATAARVAKADLASQMVYEFPELQGVMGGYYARAAGLSDEIAEACAQHYRPLGPADALPEGPVALAVALADKLDMLAGFWVIGEKPTGSKDPFALRRAALGIIRIVLGRELRLNLAPLIAAAILAHEKEQALDTAQEREVFFLDQLLDAIAKHGVFGAAFRALRTRLAEPQADGTASLVIEEGTWLARLEERVPALRDDLLGFVHERLKAHLRAEGLPHDVIDAVLARPGADDLAQVVARARALAAFLSTDDGENLVQGFRRANNILAQAEAADGVEYRYGAEAKFAEDPSEKALFVALDAARGAISSAIEAEDFAAAMGAMAALRAPIDGFFEAVQVNADNAVLRRNRLNLLNDIRETCGAVAELSRLEG